MVWWGYKAAGKAIGTSAKVGAKAGASLGDSLSSKMALHSAGRGARRGYLAPGDPTPPPTAGADYLDYRGVASWQEAQNLDDGQFPLGAFSDIAKGKVRGPIGLPGQVINRHAVVVGPAGSGKTYSLLIPWMYAALISNWSVVAVDVKGDLREDFLDFKDAQGAGALGARLTKWDFTDPLHSSPWQWLGRAARRRAGRRGDHGAARPATRSSRRRTRTSTSATTARCAACCSSHVPSCQRCGRRRTSSGFSRTTSSSTRSSSSMRARRARPTCRPCCATRRPTTRRSSGVSSRR